LVKNGMMQCTEIQRQKLNGHNLDLSAISLDEVGLVEAPKVRWVKFGYRLESASFFDKQNNSFLQLTHEELKNGKMTELKRPSEITPEDLIVSSLGQNFQDEIVSLCKLNQPRIERIYTLQTQDSININDVDCRKIEFKVSYIFSSN
jgi:hypothetical protein